MSKREREVSSPEWNDILSELARLLSSDRGARAVLSELRAAHATDVEHLEDDKDKIEQLLLTCAELRSVNVQTNISLAKKVASERALADSIREQRDEAASPSGKVDNASEVGKSVMTMIRTKMTLQRFMKRIKTKAHIILQYSVSCSLFLI